MKVRLNKPDSRLNPNKYKDKKTYNNLDGINNSPLTTKLSTSILLRSAGFISFAANLSSSSNMVYERY